VEFTMIVPGILMFLMGMLEFGLAFDQVISLSYATREGARTGSALVNGGGSLGCGTGQSPQAATVDPQVIAAVERVVTSPGSQVDPDGISEIRIYLATSTGAETTGSVNVWQRDPGHGPTVAGVPLDFSPVSEPWAACSRSYAHPAQSIGVAIRYRYAFGTPLGSLFNLFTSGGPAGLDVSDRTVMAMNPAR
jgi:hypothetical protein